MLRDVRAVAGLTSIGIHACPPTPKPTPNWKADPPRGNASKLLGAYKAWLNGVPLGVGPGRTYAQGVGVVRKTPLFEPF